jgi:hypothetical protein
MSLALSALESVLRLAAKLKPSDSAQPRLFEDAVQEARNAAVLVLVYLNRWPSDQKGAAGEDCADAQSCRR